MKRSKITIFTCWSLI